MYNLIVWMLPSDVSGGTLEIPRQRFLEYTSPAIRDRLSTVSREAIKALASWPTILMEEGRADEQAYIVRIESVRPTSENLVIRLDEEARGPIANAELWSMRRRLDIADWEFSRSHWAVKEIDLAPAAADLGLGLPPSLVDRPAMASVTPTRGEMVRLRPVLAALSVEEQDDLLMMAGVKGLGVYEVSGFPEERARTIIEFVLENPGAVTAEGRLLSAFLRDHLRPGRGSEEGANGREPDRVFVVHGRDVAAKESVVEFLRGVGLTPIVLHDQPNKGRPLLTKFFSEAQLVTFAVILMTGDDVGGLDEGSLTPRARQNVILELGYFLSHLGQPNVCALVGVGLEVPSDFHGIVYVPLDDQMEWQRELLRELRAAGLPVVTRDA